MGYILWQLLTMSVRLRWGGQFSLSWRACLSDFCGMWVAGWLLSLSGARSAQFNQQAAHWERTRKITYMIQLGKFWVCVSQGYKLFNISDFVLSVGSELWVGYVTFAYSCCRRGMELPYLGTESPSHAMLQNICVVWDSQSALVFVPFPSSGFSPFLQRETAVGVSLGSVWESSWVLPHHKPIHFLWEEQILWDCHCFPWFLLEGGVGTFLLNE